MDNIKKELTLIRELDAPRELVFKAWMDPEMVKQWWGPSGMRSEVQAWETIPGGKMDVVMVAGQELGSMAGQKWPMGGEFQEIDEPSRLVFISTALLHGKEVLQNLVTVTFEEDNHKTKMTVKIIVTKTTPEAEKPLQGMEMGWNQQLDKLVAFVKQQKA